MAPSGPSETSRLLPDELVLLMFLGSEGRPVGARLALRALEEHGVSTSEASVSRMLTRLDSLGLTSRVGRKGRMLTKQGERAYRSQVLQVRRSESFDRALELRNITEVLDWLRARRVLESEAVMLATQRRTPATIQQLTEAVEGHEQAAIDGNLGFQTVGMEFHLLIARAAQSPVFEALIESLISSKVEMVEFALDLIVASRGTLGDSAGEHRRLLDAIVAGDPEASRASMVNHLNRLEREVEQFAERSDGAALLTALSAMGVRRTGMPTAEQETSGGGVATS